MTAGQAIQGHQGGTVELTEQEAFNAAIEAYRATEAFSGAVYVPDGSPDSLLLDEILTGYRPKVYRRRKILIRYCRICGSPRCGIAPVEREIETD